MRDKSLTYVCTMDRSSSGCQATAARRMARTQRFSKPSFCFVPFIFNLPESCGTLLLPETKGDSLLASLFHSLRNPPSLPSPFCRLYSLWHLYVPYLVSEQTLFFSPLSRGLPSSFWPSALVTLIFIYFISVCFTTPAALFLLQVRCGTMSTALSSRAESQ